MDHLILARLDLVLLSKRKSIIQQILPFQQTTGQKQNKDGQISGSCLRAEKVVDHEGDGDTKCSWCPWKGLGELVWFVCLTAYQPSWVI